MSKAVRFNEYGGVDVLYVADVEPEAPGPGRVRVHVVTSSVNPGETAIRSGAFHDRWPATFPSGQGSDFAGVVAEVGEGVTGVAVGDEVIGFSDERSAHAEDVTVPAENLTPKPAQVPWNQAGTLYVAGTTAVACIRAVNLQAGETVVISGAAGGVGSIVSQLAVLAGATVIGTASESNHEYLRSIGVIPVEYGEGLAERIRQVAPGGVDAFIDTYGHGNVSVALELGVEPQRINTIIDFAAVAEHGVKSEGNAEAGNAETLAYLAELIATGKLEVPISATYTLDQIQDAYRHVNRRRGRGKISLAVR